MHGPVRDEVIVQAILAGVDRRAILVQRLPGLAAGQDRPDAEGQRLLVLVTGDTAPAAPRQAASPDLEERFQEVMRRVLPHLPESLRAEFARLLEPEALAIIAGVLALWAVSHFTPAGWAADLLFIVGGLALGEVAREIRTAR